MSGADQETSPSSGPAREVTVAATPSPGPGTRFAIGVIQVYQLFFSPWLGGRCRFEPTCSVYGVEALRVHGLVRGGWLTLRRILRCHPFGGRGFDPVPPRTDDPSASRR